MWEAPNRDRQASGHGGDVLGGAPDDSRPANPWPRLLAFGAVVLVMLVLAGTCFASYARPPARELRAELSEFTIGAPKFIPVTTFGADRSGRTFGAWITVDEAGRVTAVLSRDSRTLCHVRWDGAAPNGTATPGALADPCGAGRYTPDGTVLQQSAPHDLHAFPARLERQTVIVGVTSITLGTCRTAATDGCSPEGRPQVRSVPNNELPPTFGRQ